ncbi:MAG: hypothetical protein ABIP48_10430 [Planctomycetota bacterium]
MDDADLVQRVYREFDIRALRPEQQSLYVNLDQVRGNIDAVPRLENTIRRAEDTSTCQVLAGHYGSGKSTELLRLKQRLEAGQKPFFVVYFEGGEELDLNDVDFLDVLIVIVKQMAAQLKDRAGINLKPGYFQDRWQRLKEFFTSEISLESVDLDFGMMTLAGVIKDSPDSRTKIRSLLEPDTSNWLAAANDVISQAVQELVKQGEAGLVVVIDDLDKLIVREHLGTGCNTDEYLFVNRAAQLTAFHCHVVYSMPLSLAYSHHEPAIKGSYGGYVPVVPMTRLAGRPPSPKPYLPGIRKFREIIARRLKAAGAKQTEVFVSAKVRDDLIALSGGQPKELMALVRDAIVTHGLPVDRTSVQRAKTNGQREYARQLRLDHWPILEEIRGRGTFGRTKENELLFRELLQSRTILQYVNKEEWYGLNPMVAALKPPGKRKSAR